MIVSIAGSRDFGPTYDVTEFVNTLARAVPGSIVISGGRGNVDKTAEASARQAGLDVISYRPVQVGENAFEIVTYAYGKQADAMVEQKCRRWTSPVYSSFGQCCYGRNIWVVEDGERLVAFWDGKSPGTGNSIELAKKRPVPVSVMLPGQPMREIFTPSERITT